MSKNGITIAVVGACVLALWFATRLTPSAPAPPPEPPPPAVVCETWQQTLSARVGKSILMSDELTAVLLELHKAGDITDAELRSVQESMPDLVMKNRALTEADAEKIRQVK